MAACALAPAVRAAPTPRWRYEVDVAADLRRLDVRLCFDDFRPLRLTRAAGGAFEHLRPAPEDPNAGGFDAGAGSWTIAPATASCVSYVVDLAEVATSTRRSEARADAVVSEAGRWLLRPAHVPPDVETTLAFRLPDGVRVSTPWKPVASTPAAYALPTSTWQFIGHVAFGRALRQESWSESGATIEVTWMPGDLRATPAGVRRWLGAAAQAVGTLWGRFPRDRVQVLLHPSGGGGSHGGDLVDFGSSWQGGGPALQLWLGETAADDALPGEWVAVHEMVHLAMPPIDHEDAWLSEGFATYYQEVLRARAGFLTPLAAWRALDDGFRRGRRSDGRATLAQASREMHRTHDYLRVYWGGAAVALLLDVELRRAGDGARSLDDVMRLLWAKHGAVAQLLSARQAIADVDAWAGAPVFARIADAALASTTSPSLEEAYAFLGLRREGDELVEDATAPGASVRDAILAKERRTRSGPLAPK